MMRARRTWLEARRYSAVVVCVLLAYVAVLTWPFEWELPTMVRNQAHFGHGSGLSFAGHGIARTPAAPSWARDLHDGQVFELQIRLRSSSQDQHRSARIVTLSKTAHLSNFTLAQMHDRLIVWVKQSESWRDYLSPEYWRPTIILQGVFTRTSAWLDAVIRVETGRLQVSLNGEMVAEVPVEPGTLASWDPAFKLAFGNEQSYDRPWIGEISHAAVWVDEDSYAYVGTGSLLELEVPSRYLFIPNRPVLVPFSEPNLLDNIANIALFMPLGMLLAVRTPTARSRMQALLLIGLFSLGLESLQLFVSTRTAAVEDVVLNTLGGFVGLVLGVRFWQFWALREIR